VGGFHSAQFLCFGTFLLYLVVLGAPLIHPSVCSCAIFRALFFGAVTAYCVRWLSAWASIQNVVIVVVGFVVVSSGVVRSAEQPGTPLAGEVNDAELQHVDARTNTRRKCLHREMDQHTIENNHGCTERDDYASSATSCGSYFMGAVGVFFFFAPSVILGGPFSLQRIR